MKIDPANANLRESHHIQMNIIVPRPIAFISTIGQDGVFDVAPYSSFMTLATRPNLVGLSTGRLRDGRKKRTLVNIEASKEFVLNLVTEAMAEAMNRSAGTYASNVDKFKAAGLTAVKADQVKSPMVAESPVNMECRVVQMMEFGEAPQLTTFIIGQVLLVHIKDEFYANGEIPPDKLKAIGRLGGELYCRTTDIFAMKRPD